MYHGKLYGRHSKNKVFNLVIQEIKSVLQLHRIFCRLRSLGWGDTLRSPGWGEALCSLGLGDTLGYLGWVTLYVL